MAKGSEDPIVDSVGIVQHPRGGWVVVMFTTQGTKVLTKEVVSRDPEPKAHAVMRAQNEVTKHFLMPKAGASS